jgi:hypothetical protein
MKIFFIIIFNMILTVKAFSEEIKAELSLISPPAILKEGDILEGVLKVWPLENSNIDEFKKIENTTLANFFYISEVEKVEPSINNSEVAEAKVLIIVKKSNHKSEQSVMLRDKVINIISPSATMAPTEKASADYYVMTQEENYSNLAKIVIIVVILTLILLVYYKRKSIQYFLSKYKNDPTSIYKIKMKEMFNNASNREDFEEIYALRKEWLGLINDSADSCRNFFEIIEMHQYKKNWDSGELLEVKKSFDPIRGSFV